MGPKMFEYGPFLLWEDDGFVCLDDEDVAFPECDPDMGMETYVQDAHVQAKLAEVAHRRIAHAKACREWLDARTGGEGQLDLFPPRSPRYDPQPGDRLYTVEMYDSGLRDMRQRVNVYRVTARGDDALWYADGTGEVIGECRISLDAWAAPGADFEVWLAGSDTATEVEYD
jgi:hypothetical protein